MILREVLSWLDRLAPLRFAESWDNVGLIAGDPEAAITRILVTIDCTPEIVEEAASEGCDLIVAYHPPWFEAAKRLPATSVVFQAVRRGIAVYSPHTALDAADGGTNDVLADVLGLRERIPLTRATGPDTHLKLVTFVPETHVKAVSEALFAAGAGHIGAYEACSFRSAGTGTFFGRPGTKPFVGEAGMLNEAPEVRLETLVPIAKQEAAVQALRGAHPYEEPAFDLARIAAISPLVGMGRAGVLPEPAAREALFARIKEGLGVGGLLVAGPTEGVVSRVAVCAGAGRGLLKEALSHKTELFLTGELPHHDALKAASAGMTVVCVLHSNSERRTLATWGQRLSEALGGLPVLRSRVDRDPFVFC